MIHDALLVLWDCSNPSDSRKRVNQCEWSTLPDEKEIYGHICDIGKSHHRIQSFINGYSFRSRRAHAVPSNPSTFGLYSQALSEGMDSVLHSYKETLMDIERQVLSNQSYTLSYVYGRVNEYRSLFIMLNQIITSVKERQLRGCQILSLVHQHILCGSDTVRNAVLKMFSNVNAVFMNQLCSWLLYGELKDPYQEFFIYNTQDRNDSRETIVSSPSTYEKTLATSIRETPIECGCAVNTLLVPYFIPHSLVQEILFIGKTVILFGFDPRDKRNVQSLPSNLLILQNSTNSDSKRFTIWDNNEAEFHEKLQRLKDPEVFEVSALKNVVGEIKACVTQHLWHVTVREARLLHELRLLKDFYLLGRGELFLELLRLASHVFDHVPTRTSTRDINRAFQAAARAVHLAGSPDIDKFALEIPYVRQSQHSHLSADSTLPSDSSASCDGWSSVVLKYEFSWPLHLLFTPECLARYNDMFRLLLRIKKTQRDLHALWKQCKQRSFATCRLHSQLVFLLDNLQRYLQADVLETNFSKLLAAAAETQDFERLKRAHRTFIDDVTTQSFLTVLPSHESSAGHEESDIIDNPVFYTIMDLLKLCHAFCSTSQAGDFSTDSYHIVSYTQRFETLVARLLQLLTSLRTRPCGAYLARLLMRLDYNRWFSGAHLTQSVTSMLY